MTIVSLLLFALVVFLIYVAIQKFLPEPMKTWALAIVGVVVVIALITQLWPGLANFRISK